MTKQTPPDYETITAKDLEQQVRLQSVREMIIVQAEDGAGYQLHVPLRDFTGGVIRQTAGGKAEAVLQVSKPRMRVLATRREQSEPRHYKKIETLHGYISETFPEVEMVQLRISKQRKTAADDAPRQAGRRSLKKPATPAPTTKATKVAKVAKKAKTK